MKDKILLIYTENKSIVDYTTYKTMEIKVTSSVKTIEIIPSNFITKATCSRNHYKSPAELQGSAEHSLKPPLQVILALGSDSMLINK